ncbi:MAG: hypothetical protein WD229_02730, partial [Pirellulales bacterium]
MSTYHHGAASVPETATCFPVFVPDPSQKKSSQERVASTSRIQYVHRERRCRDSCFKLLGNLIR